MNVDLREGVADPAADGRHERPADPPERADAEPWERLAARGAHLGLCRLEPRKHRRGVTEEDASLLGELERPSPAHADEETRADQPLEREDSAR